MMPMKTMTPRNDNEAKWAVFHNDNPQVAHLLTHFAKQVAKRGFKKYSMYSLFNRVRWHVEVETNGDKFKLNNNFAPYYARHLMATEPSLKGFFHTRTVNGDA